MLFVRITYMLQILCVVLQFMWTWLQMANVDCGSNSSIKQIVFSLPADTVFAAGRVGTWPPIWKPCIRDLKYNVSKRETYDITGRPRFRRNPPESNMKLIIFARAYGPCCGVLRTARSMVILLVVRRPNRKPGFKGSKSMGVLSSRIVSSRVLSFGHNDAGRSDDGIARQWQTLLIEGLHIIMNYNLILSFVSRSLLTRTCKC